MIPNREPEIRIGIVLPEDRYTQIAGQIPSASRYLVIDAQGRKELIPAGGAFEVSVQQEVLVFKAAEWTGSSSSFRLESAEEMVLAPGSGIQLQNVIAGRHFHWKKTIDVFLPGRLIFTMRNGMLQVTNQLDFEQYLACVATSEMSPECPAALLEAQTIAARSWLLAAVEKKHADLGLDACNDDCCQRYQGTTFLTSEALRSTLRTRGQVLMFEDQLCDARYSKSCGGMMEAFENVWGGNPKPYLIVKADATDDFKRRYHLTREEDLRAWLKEVPRTFCSPHYVSEKELSRYLGGVDESSRYFRWNVCISQDELTNQLNAVLDLNAEAVLGFRALQRGGSGRLVKLEIAYQNRNGKKDTVILKGDYAIRRALHPKFLYSSAILIEPIADTSTAVPEKFRIEGAGWGHGVGLCQIGALGMALAGYSSNAILNHYYPGAVIKTLYP